MSFPLIEPDFSEDSPQPRVSLHRNGYLTDRRDPREASAAALSTAFCSSEGVKFRFLKFGSIYQVQQTRVEDNVSNNTNAMKNNNAATVTLLRAIDSIIEAFCTSISGSFSK